MPPAVSHLPHRTCCNYPICTLIEARPKVGGKRTLGNSLCTERNARGECAHPGCINPRPADLYKNEKKKTNPYRTHGLCTNHMADTCYNTIREIWTRCSKEDAGYRFLSMKRGGGPCFACSGGNLPCRNALRGCPCHVRGSTDSDNLRTCTTQGSSCCSFDPSNSKSVCQVPWCANAIHDDSPAPCADCQQGRTPCAAKCGRRAVVGKNGRCEYCRDDGTSAILDASVTHYCATACCRNVVLTKGICWHCSTGSLPCELAECKGRTVNSSQVRCEGCLSGTIKRTRLVVKGPSQPCRFADRARVGTTPA